MLGLIKKIIFIGIFYIKYSNFCPKNEFNTKTLLCVIIFGQKLKCFCSEHQVDLYYTFGHRDKVIIIVYLKPSAIIFIFIFLLSWKYKVSGHVIRVIFYLKMKWKQ